MKDNTILGINVDLFLAMTSLVLAGIDTWLATEKFKVGDCYGIFYVIYAIWFAYIGFMKWCDYITRKKQK